MSRRDWKVIGALGIALGLLFYFFLYRPAKDRRDVVVSKENLHAIYNALSLYAVSNSDGLPIVYQRQAGGAAYVDAFGSPVTWANIVYGYGQLQGRLNNPKSRREWDTLLADPCEPDKTINLSYGMVAALSAERIYAVKDPNKAILLAETIGGGHANTRNPYPLDVPGGRDGFLIGYSDNNFSPTEDSEFATRLAFIADAAGAPDARRRPIHPGRAVLAITVGGNLIELQPVDMRVDKAGKVPIGRWAPFR